MCGRMVGVKSRADLEYRLQQLQDADFWKYMDAALQMQPVTEYGRYNISPMQKTLIVRETLDDGVLGGRLEPASWGLVPVWAKDKTVGVRAFNARTETADTKPTFRSAWAKRRALIPVEGYYEWQKPEKTPYFIHPKDGGGMFFAGLYEWWQEDKASDDSWMLSCTVLTAPAADDLAPIHDRMPLVMPDDLGMDWLNPATTDKAEVRGMVDEAISRMPNTLTMYEVGKDVGNWRNQGPDLIAPVS